VGQPNPNRNEMKHWRLWLSIIAGLGTCTSVGYFCHGQLTAARRLAAWNEQQQRDAAAIAALEKPVDLGNGELTLKDFAAVIQTQTGVAVSVDEDSLKLVNVSPTQPVTVQSKRAGLAAEAQLTLALKDLELCWVAKDGQIIITTPENADTLQFVVATYVLPQADFDAAADAQAWAQAITSVIEPDGWDDVGGRGHCAAAGGALVIAHRPEVQRQIRAVFDGLRAAGNPPATWEPVRLGPDMSNAADAAVQARLQRPAKVECVEMPLKDVVKYLETEYELPLVLSTKKLEEASVSPDTPVTISLSGVTLDSLLRQMLKDLELVVVVRNSVAQITTPEDAESQLVLVGYPIHDLVATPYGPDYDSLVELISSTIRPASWGGVGGPGAIDYVAGWLLIPQTMDVHEELEAVLSDLRQQLALGPATSVFANPRRRTAEARIVAALERPVQASFHEQSLTRVCDELTSQLGVPVRCAKKLEEASISIDTPITGEFPIAPARVQLRRLLRPLELTYVIRDEALLITTPEDAENRLTTRVYDVRPLVDNDVGLFRTGGPMQDADSLIEMITSLLSPDSWDDVSGPGAIDFYRGLLVISQTQDVQDELAAFLAELRRAMLWRDQPGVMPATELSAAEKSLAPALEREISLNYFATPLADVAQDLSRRLGTTVHLAVRKLEEASLSLQTPVSGRFPSAPARVQLARLCDLLDLAYLIRDDWIVITTPEHAESWRQTRIYDVRSLVFPHGQIGKSSHPDLNTLIEAITSQVHVDSWDDVGGPGSIDGVQGVLAVAQTQEVHREVAALLDVLHRLQETRLPGEAELPNAIWVMPDETEERIYEKLAEPVDIELTEAPLAQSFLKLSQRSGVPIRVDQERQQEVWAALKTAVSVSATGLTLAGVLDRLLPEDVQYTIRNQELLISSAAGCEVLLRLRLYRVDDLTSPGATNLEAVIRRLITEVQPERWDDLGGNCSISAWQDRWLLVAADVVTHQRLDDWLQQRRTGAVTQRARERSELEKLRGNNDTPKD
jgi:hypothetical protein